MPIEKPHIISHVSSKLTLMKSRVNTRHLINNCSWADITRHERNKQQDALFYHPGKGIHFVVWIWYSQKKRLFLSDGFSEMMGIPKGKTPSLEQLAECILSDDLEEFFAFMKEMVQGRRPEHVTFSVCTPDGTVRRIRCDIGMMEDDVVGVCYELFN